MSRTDRESGGLGRMMVFDGHHVALIVGVIFAVLLLLMALLAIENRRKDRDLDVLLSRSASEVQRAYEEGKSRGRIDSIESLLVQMDQRLQTAEVTLGLRAERAILRTDEDSGIDDEQE